MGGSLGVPPKILCIRSIVQIGEEQPFIVWMKIAYVLSQCLIIKFF